ncbi:unnamed protein product [Phytophthora lilii]|uniref:Unnamed protein product n=1 Tax=Phytophthora lilii TaxID=2077276 RepID=A0A9W6TCH3_9STRA|nr:unnamed protein product [Phytophthora lilii]
MVSVKWRIYFARLQLNSHITIEVGHECMPDQELLQAGDSTDFVGAQKNMISISNRMRQIVQTMLGTLVNQNLA